MFRDLVLRTSTAVLVGPKFADTRDVTCDSHDSSTPAWGIVATAGHSSPQGLGATLERLLATDMLKLANTSRLSRFVVDRVAGT
jgi:hypothetical protein